MDLFRTSSAISGSQATDDRVDCQDLCSRALSLWDSLARQEKKQRKIPSPCQSPHSGKSKSVLRQLRLDRYVSGGQDGLGDDDSEIITCRGDARGDHGLNVVNGHRLSPTSHRRSRCEEQD